MVFETLCANMFRRKTLEDPGTDSSLKKCLTLGHLTCLSISGMVGGGLYVLTGTVAHDIAGPSVCISYVIAALASLLSAVCYAEFGARVPIAGSAYQFTYLSVGEFWAFMIGWNVFFEHVVAMAAVAKVWSSNFDAAINNVISSYLSTHCPLPGGGFLALYPDFVAAAIILLTVLIAITGVKSSASFNAFFTTLNLTVIIVIIGAGFYLGDIKNWRDVEGGFFPYGVAGTISGASTLVYAFIGYDVIGSAVEEAENPKRDVPLSLFISLIAVALAYVGASAALTLMVPYDEIDNAAPFPSAFAVYGVQWARYLVTVGVLIATYGPMLSSLYSTARYLVAMSRDGLLPPILSKVHETTKEPYVSTVTSTVIAIVMTIFLDQTLLVELLSIGQLVACIFVSISVIKLRYEVNVLSYDKMEEIPPVLPHRIAPTAPPSEITPLRKLSADGHISGTQSNEAFSEEISSIKSYSSDTLTYDSSDDVIAGSLKPWALLYFKQRTQSCNITHSKSGAAPKWLLFVSMTSGFAAIVIGRFGGITSSLIAVVLLAIFAMFALLSISALLLFQQDTSIKSFKVPLVPFLPFFSAIINMLLIINLQPTTWLRLAIWLIVGLVVYCGYGYRNSTAGKSD